MSSFSIHREISRALGGVAITRLANLIIVFFSSVLAARVLGPNAFGTYAFVMSVISLLSLVSCLGVPALLTREIVKYEHGQSWELIGGLIKRSNQLVIGTTLFLMFLAALGSIAFRTADHLDRWTLILLSLPILPAIGISTIRVAALRGLRRVVLGTVPETIVRPLFFLICLGSLTLFNSATVENAIYSQVLSAYLGMTVGVIIFSRLAAKNLTRINLEYKTLAWTKMLIPFSGIAAVSFFNVEFINIFLGLSATNEDIAMFRVAANLALFVALPLTLIETVMMPYVTRYYSSGDLYSIQRLSQIASLASLCFSAFPALILMIFGEKLIKEIYGIEYISAYWTLVVIISGYMLVNLVGLSMQLLYATNYQSVAFRISLFGAIVTIIGCLILIPYFGTLGAGIVLGFGKALRAFFFVFSARKLLKIKTSIIW